MAPTAEDLAAEVLAVAAAGRGDLEAFGIWTAGDVRVALATSHGLTVSDRAPTPS